MGRRGAGFAGCLIMSLFFATAVAQVSDDFSDGDFTNNPAWIGDTGKFEVNAAFQLHLKGSASDTSSLSTPSTLIDSTEWNFWVKLSFSPSANNYARVYLVADTESLGGPVRGYFIQLGEAGSSDAIRLCRQDGSDTVTICRGNPGLIAASFTARIRVTRAGTGNWAIFCDPAGGTNYTYECRTRDTTYRQSRHFGVFCQYTSSNATKCYFDDFLVRQIYYDKEPPLAEQLTVIDSTCLLITFNEELSRPEAENIRNYMIDHGIDHPDSARLDATDASTVYLWFSQPFSQGLQYHLVISGISDLSGNITDTITMAFVHYIPRAYDVVVNEIMADPEPQNALPPVEYTEIFNTTGFAICLEGWMYQWSSYTRILPRLILEPHAYLIFCKPGDSIFLRNFGKVCEIQSFSVPNEGSAIILRNASGQVIHSLFYSKEWYGNPLKEEGGWSLEQIDPQNPCGAGTNWTASIANRGGTPGSINSVDGDNPDLSAPRAVRAYPADENTVRVHFSETLDSISIPALWQTFLDEPSCKPLGVCLYSPDYLVADLDFADTLETGMTYCLHVHSGYRDCAGNISLISDTLRLGLPAYPAENDIVINEVLFHPDEAGAEFVELLNISAKVLDLKDLVISVLDSAGGIPGNPSGLSDVTYLLFPGDYVVLSESPEQVKTRYFTPAPDAFVKVASFPSLPDDGGWILISDKSLNKIDMMQFTESIHYPLLDNTAGVSLEKINPEITGTITSNWHSASSSSGYATPAWRNSQYRHPDALDDYFNLEPQVFSPDNDGHNDLLEINYKLPETGFSGSVFIFTLEGCLVKQLVNNELFGTEGNIHWDGLSDRRLSNPEGIYLVFIELFNMKGDITRIRKPCAIVYR